MRVALGVEYDGRGFCGWQSQAPGCGVQDALERGLSAVAGDAVRVVAAGRTDTGVHAVEQVVHFDTASVRPLSAWVRGTNTAVKPGLAVLWAAAVPERFHARFAATGRTYTYVVLNRAARPGLLAGRVGWYHRPLDETRMREAATLLIGTHDFSAFRAAECQADSPVRELRELTIARAGELIVFRVTANAFLHKMVRNIVGSLLYVGKGKHPPPWIGDVLAARRREQAAPTFAPDGLYLTSIEYDSAWKLPGRPRTPLPILL